MNDDDRLKLGEKVRREVFGIKYDDYIQEIENEFSEPLRNFTARYAWAEVWASDDLPRKTRSLINVAILTAMRCSPELKAHIRGARNNGCTKDEIRAVLKQVGVYCGVPLMREGVRMANAVFREEAETK